MEGGGVIGKVADGKVVVCLNRCWKGGCLLE